MSRGDHGYLKFVIEDGFEAIDYRYGLQQKAPALYYGWAEYFVDSDGTFKIVNSAIDFAFNEIIDVVDPKDVPIDFRAPSERRQ